MKERNTKQKQAVYDALRSLGHPSATEVYEYVRKDNPAISRGTVFRVLRGFAESGRARRLHFAGSDERFDATLTPHFHALCKGCGKISDVPYFSLEDAFQALVKSRFQAEELEAEFRGLCADCAKKQK